MTRPSISVGQGRATQASPLSTPAPFSEPITSKDAAAPRARRPFGSHQQRLAYPTRSGYHRHWFNDVPGRLVDAQAAGYDFVADPQTGDKVNRVVGVGETGHPQMGFLMEIPEEWYKEDMAAQQKDVDARDNAIRRGAVSGEPGVDGVYIPAQGIKISK